MNKQFFAEDDRLAEQSLTGIYNVKKEFDKLGFSIKLLRELQLCIDNQKIKFSIEDGCTVMDLVTNEIKEMENEY